MRGAIKHIILLFVAVIVIIFLAIPVLRRMEPRHDIAQPPVHDTSGARIAPTQKSDTARVRDEQEAASKPSAEPEWKPVAAWEGHGDMKSKRFTIVVPTWRLAWEVEMLPARGVEMFQVMVYDDQGGLKSFAANTNRTDQGSTILPGPGTFTFEIKTVQNWKVKVEEKG